MKPWRLLFLCVLIGLTGCRAGGDLPATETAALATATRAPEATPTPTALPTATSTVTPTPTAEPTKYLPPTPHALHYLVDLGITVNIPARAKDPFSDARYSSDKLAICWMWPYNWGDAKSSNKGELCVTYPKTSLGVADFPSSIQKKLAGSYSHVAETSTQDFATDSGIEGKKIVYQFTAKEKEICVYYLFPHEWRGILQFEFCRFEAFSHGLNSTDDIDPVIDGIVRSTNWLYDKQFFFGKETETPAN
jgi:hypothetical protein